MPESEDARRERPVFQRFLIYLAQFFLGVFSIYFLSMTVLAFLWQTPTVILLCFTGVLVFLPANPRFGQFTIIRIGLTAIFLVFAIGFAPIHIKEISNTMMKFHNKIKGYGAASLSDREVLAIYGANLVMGVTGLVIGYPEAGIETLLLMFPGEKERRFESDFAMKSTKVRNAYMRFADLLKTVPKSKKSLKMGEISLFWKEYSSDSDRVSLALNPVKLNAVAYLEGVRWRIDCVAIARVEYHNGKAKLFSIYDSDFIIEESIFQALQIRGILHPYSVIYTWSIYSDDKRLQAN